MTEAKSKLRAASFSAVRWTSVAMVGRTVLQFAQMAILARLLVPEDFGLMAIVLSIMAFTQVFADFGISSAIIHFKEISRSQLSTLYWLNLMVGFLLMAIILILSYPLSYLVFNKPNVQPLLMVMSVSVLFMTVGQQIRVMAEKELRFPIIAKVEIIASIIAFSTSLIWAILIPSAYALVAGIVAMESSKALLLWLFARDGWRPEFYFKLKEINHLVKFGSYILLTNLVNSVNSQADVLIAGRVFPTATLGLFSLPRNLSLKIGGIINPVVTRVGLPVMAEAQNDLELLRTIYLKIMRMTASINFPIYFALAFFSKDIVEILFGSKWIDADSILKLLAIWGMFRSCSNPVGGLLVAVGKARLSFFWNVLLLFIVPPTLWIASKSGVNVLAAAQAVLAAFLLIPGWYFLVRPSTGIGGAEYAMSLLIPFGCAASSVGLAYTMVAPIDFPAYRLLVGGGIAVPAYFAVSALVNRTWLKAMFRLVANH
jgi:O-antigen/teichoic acid export membrane protein